MKGFILKRTPYGESDLILTVLLEDSQRVTTFAPAGRKSKKRFPHQFDLTGLYDWMWTREASSTRLIRLAQADLVSWAPEISKDFESWTRWLIILEWISRDPEPGEVFSALLEIREGLRGGEGARLFHQFFQIEMKRHGIFPELDHCARCQKAVSEETHFCLNQGSVVHADCQSGLPLSPESRAFLKNPHGLLKDSLDLDRISVPYLMQQLDVQLKTQSVFEQLEHSNPSRDWHRVQ